MRVTLESESNARIERANFHPRLVCAAHFIAEVWTLEVGTMKRLETFQLCCHRILRISWVSNEETQATNALQNRSKKIRPIY